MQTTIRREIAIPGHGLHSGRPARLKIRPAGPDHGIWFFRRDVRTADPWIPARWDAVCDTSLNTTLGNAAGVTVSTVEHLMAALVGCGVTNALVEIDGPEIPILDGSAQRFVERIYRAGVVPQAAARRDLRILRRVEVREGAAMAALAPASGFGMSFEIAFPDAAIGRQSLDLSFGMATFACELADSRTFCRRAEIDLMRSRGLALGGTLDNAVVVDGDEVLNPGGFRRPDECVRHKMLDAVGDLALAGAPVIGRYTGVRAGHGLTNRLLRRLFEDSANFEFVRAAPETAPRRSATARLSLAV